MRHFRGRIRSSCGIFSIFLLGLFHTWLPISDVSVGPCLPVNFPWLLCVSAVISCFVSTTSKTSVSSSPFVCSYPPHPSTLFSSYWSLPHPQFTMSIPAFSDVAKAANDVCTSLPSPARSKLNWKLTHPLTAPDQGLLSHFRLRLWGQGHHPKQCRL